MDIIDSAVGGSNLLFRNSSQFTQLIKNNENEIIENNTILISDNIS